MDSKISRKTIYGLNLLIMVVVMIVVLGLVNWLGTKHYKRWDLAKPASEVLSDQTVNLLKNLDREVKLTYFFTYSATEEEEMMNQEWKDLLERYKALSKHFDYEMIDYVKNPMRVENFIKGTKQISLEKNSSVVLCGDYVEKINDTTEAALTGAIIKVTRGQVRSVCFTEGHGEHDPDESGSGGYYRARQGLEGENFEIKRINLLREGVPEGCNLLIVAGPVLPFKSQENEMLEKWLDAGGKMMLMFDATGATGLESLMEKYGIGAYDDVLKTDESAAMGIDPYLVFADTYNPTHPITTSLSQMGVLVGDRVRTIPSTFYEARSLSILENTGDMDVEALITTSDNVIVLSSDDAPMASRYGAFRREAGQEDSGGAMAAPVGEVGAQIVAAYALKTVEKEEPKTTGETEMEDQSSKTARLVVFGDSDFAADGFIDQMPSADIFLNSIAWLAEEEESIGIRPRKKKFVPIHFAGQNNWLILLGVLFIVPLVVLINGILVWREKKRL